jgi:hypothetical protein
MLTMRKLKIDFQKNYMRKCIFLLIVFICTLLNSCIYEHVPEVIPKLVITGLADSSIVLPNSIQQYIATPIAKWTIN